LQINPQTKRPTLNHFQTSRLIHYPNVAGDELATESRTRVPKENQSALAIAGREMPFDGVV
jgi:hypothetical protein